MSTNLPILVVPPACETLLKLQRTDDPDVATNYSKDLHAAFKTFERYLPTQSRFSKFAFPLQSEVLEETSKEDRNFFEHAPIQLLDLGCGLGGISALLCHHYQGYVDLVMADVEKLDRQPRYGYTDDPSAYHSFSATYDFLNANKVNHKALKFHDLSCAPLGHERYDVVISLLSWGFHYPIRLHAPRLVPGGVAIVDLRHGGRAADELKALYPKAHFTVVHRATKYNRVVVQC